MIELNSKVRTIIVAVLVFMQTLLLMVIIGGAILKFPQGVCCISVILVIGFTILSWFAWDRLLIRMGVTESE